MELDWKKSWTFVICWAGGLFAGLDATLYNLMLPQMSDHFPALAGVSQISTLLLAIFLLGWMIGGILFGIIADRFGRVQAMTISMLLYAFFTGSMIAASHVWQLGYCRFFVGLGIGGQMVSMTVLLSETLTGKSRSLAMGALITSYQAGVFAAGLVGTFASGWQQAFLIGSVPVLIAMLAGKTLQEPIKVAKISARDPSSLSNPIYLRRLVLASIGFGALLIGYWATVAWVPSWIHTLAATSSGNEKYIATLWHGLAAVLGCFLAGPLTNRFGRTKTLGVTLILAFAVASGMFYRHATMSSSIYVEYSLLGVLIGLGQGGFYLYLAELFPKEIKATAVGISLNSGRLITVIAVLCLSPLITLFGSVGNALIGFSSLFLLGALAIFFNDEKDNLPETLIE